MTITFILFALSFITLVFLITSRIQEVENNNEAIMKELFRHDKALEKIAEVITMSNKDEILTEDEIQNLMSDLKSIMEIE